MPQWHRKAARFLKAAPGRGDEADSARLHMTFGERMKKISILGSTGSIGTQTLDVVRHHREELEIEALSAGHNIRLLEQQVREFHPSVVSVWEEKDALELRSRLADLSVRVCCGMAGLTEVATAKEAQMVVGAIVGMIGIVPTIEAIRAGKDIALANKETLVTAGHIIMPLVSECGVHLYPVDSEHSAIFQCLRGEGRDRIEKILLTCSGGPFFGFTKEQLAQVTVEDALKNPNWKMGNKITVDSASLVNKGLEVMEAGWLFRVPADRIQVVIQRQSIVHSAVQFVDGAVIAQMGTPDMRLPIQYALFYPDRRPMETKRLDLFELGSITFDRPDTDTFRGLDLAYRAMREGGSMPTVFNAANEYAVSRFLSRKISLPQIYEIIESCMDSHHVIPDPTIRQVLDVQQETEEMIRTRFDR